MPQVHKIVPFLWYAKEAEAAAKLYASIFPRSSVDRVSSLPVESPSGPPGSVKVVEFTLCGQPFQAMSAGPLDPFNHAISLMVYCDSQKELDGYWKKLLAGGGVEEQCGWLRDRYGVCWQIVPRGFEEMMASKDREAAARCARAMMTMVKFDIAALEAAFRGDGARAPKKRAAAPKRGKKPAARPRSAPAGRAARRAPKRR